MHRTITQGFGKDERLHSKKDIQELFDKGSSFYLYPFKIIHLKPEGTNVHQVLISVSKRNFKNASDRNLIKRRIREAYRKNKTIIAEAAPMRIAYIYTRREILAFDVIEKAMVKTFKKLLTT